MADNRLNDNQEKFCQAIMRGETQRQAYCSAYPNSAKWKDSSVDSKASALANSDKVSTRLAELRAEAETKNQISRSDLLDQLKKIGFADIDMESVKPKDKIRAIEAMVKILGFDRPEQTVDTDQLSALKSIFEGLKNAD